jgi:uncharacterized lipoprotein
MSSMPAQILRLVVVVAAAMAVTACAGVTCERPERYAGAGSVPPLQVPDGLAEPDLSRALRIPAMPVEEPRPIGRRGPCLESPPHFFDRPLLED